MKNSCLCVLMATLGTACVLLGMEAGKVDYEAGEQSAALVTPEVEQAAAALLGASAASQLVHAVRLNMAKYDIDMRSDAGRAAWHGRRVHEIIDTNALTKVTVYSNAVDGTVWRYRESFQPMSLKPYTPKATTAYTNGIPVRLAKARLARAAENVVSNVTVNVQAN